MQKIVPNIWFDNNAEEATDFYTNIFKNSKKKEVAYHDAASAQASGQPEGSVLTTVFEIEGYEMMTVNGGPTFKPNPAISFTVSVNSAEEIDRLWQELSPNGVVLMPLDSYPFSQKYGWIEDKYGFSWQLILADEAVEQKIIPSFLFTQDQFGKAEEAIKLYTSLFENSEIEALNRYNDGLLDEATAAKYGDAVAHAVFSLNGENFIAMDGGGEHEFQFNEAVSLIVNCETQEEIDKFWHGLSAQPEAEQCGWLKDKFGVSWQITPIILGELLSDPDPAKASRTMEAMLQMKKLDIAELKKAHQGK